MKSKNYIIELKELIRDEEYLLKCIEDIKAEVYENNVILKQICKVINVYLANHHQENEDDFGRNVLANLVSNIFDIKRIRK